MRKTDKTTRRHLNDSDVGVPCLTACQQRWRHHDAPIRGSAPVPASTIVHGLLTKGGRTPRRSVFQGHSLNLGELDRTLFTSSHILLATCHTNCAQKLKLHVPARSRFERLGPSAISTTPENHPNQTLFRAQNAGLIDPPSLRFLGKFWVLFLATIAFLITTNAGDRFSTPLIPRPVEFAPTSAQLRQQQECRQSLQIVTLSAKSHRPFTTNQRQIIQIQFSPTRPPPPLIPPRRRVRQRHQLCLRQLRRRRQLKPPAIGATAPTHNLLYVQPPI
jgi:hypothetical protein